MRLLRVGMVSDHEVAVKWEAVGAFLNERGRRRWAAAEAQTLGRGGLTTIARVTGLSINTIKAGIADLATRGAGGDALPMTRSRRAGAGRPRVEQDRPELVATLERLVAPVTRGDPMSPLLWTSKSTKELASTLVQKGFRVTDRTVARLLHDAGYSLQALRKTREGTADHPDRDAQFRYIQQRIRAQQRAGEPVISVDCKKKERVGDFKNGGREWQPRGQPEPVRVHDFLDPALGKAIPYGVYDVLRNEGWVSVGIDHETAEFAAATVLRWWRQMGRRAYPAATTLQIIADGGGANGARNRLWKCELQRVADATGLMVRVCHLPPGTSKWNKIEHRMFCHITQNWRGRPLLSHQVVVKLIAATRTRRGLKIRAALDPKSYPTGVEVSDDEIAALSFTPDRFHGEWNYAIAPISAEAKTVK
jgi:transposase